MSLKIVVMGSTRGSSIQELFDCIKQQTVDAVVSLVVSDNENAPILQRAKMQIFLVSV